MNTPNIVIVPNDRPTRDLATIPEATALAQSVFPNSLLPPPTPGSQILVPLASSPIVEIVIRPATPSELMYTPADLATFAQLGYFPLLMEWFGPSITDQQGNPLIRDTPPQQSPLSGRPAQMGFVFYSALVSLNYVALQQKPRAAWYIDLDGDLQRI